MFLKLFGKNPRVPLESQVLPEFDFEIDSLHIQNIVLVPDASAAHKFMEVIFPHYCELYLASADGEYPQNPALNKAVFEKIHSDEKINLIVLGYDSLITIRPKTKKLLVLDDFILGFSSTWMAERQFKKDIDEFVVINYIKSFFFQWQRIERLGSATNYYRFSPGFDREKLGPIFDLFIRHEKGSTS